MDWWGTARTRASQLGVRVAGQALPSTLAEAVELLVQTPSQKGAGVYAGRCGPGWETVATVLSSALGVPEWLTRAQHAAREAKEPIWRPGRRRRQVAAVGAHHHGHGVPAYVGTQALFDGDVARGNALPARLDGVHVAGVAENGRSMLFWRACSSICSSRNAHAWTPAFDDGGQCVHPFTRLLIIRYRLLGRSAAPETASPWVSPCVGKWQFR